MKHFIFVLAVSSVFTQNPPEHTQMVEQAFLRLDLHPKDGLPEENELTTIFTDLDTDSNGKLTYAEFAAHAIDNLQRHQLFDSFDTNKDGFLTKIELVDAMDVNGDNQVTKNEFAHYYLNVRVFSYIVPNGC